MGKTKPGDRRSTPCKGDEAARRVPALSEADLERYGTELLALDGWRSLKTDPVSRREWGKGFGERGMADRLYLRYQSRFIQPSLGLKGSIFHCNLITPAEVLWIEWKRLKGKVAPHQLNWIMCERKRGALVLLADEDFEATPEGFAAWYRNSGLLRRQGLC